MGIRAPYWLLALCILTACTGPNPRASIIPVYDLKMQGRSTGAAIVESGDTLGGIANRYGLSVSSLISANMLGDKADLVRPNQRIILPPPATYTVKAGDSFDRIARMFDTTEDALARANNLQAPYQLQAGQVLKISQPKKMAQKPRPPIVTTGVSAPVVPVTSSVIPASPSVIPAKAGIHRATSATSQMTGIFAKPIKGEIISGYGPKAGGLYNDGINIAAKAGTPVGAAKSGTVVFAGEGPDGYGKMVLLRHDDGYFTVYSHLSQIKVQEGGEIAKGAILGNVGATGKVKEPQLHFEIRKGTAALNPEDFI